MFHCIAVVQLLLRSAHLFDFGDSFRLKNLYSKCRHHFLPMKKSGSKTKLFTLLLKLFVDSCKIYCVCVKPVSGHLFKLIARHYFRSSEIYYLVDYAEKSHKG